MQHRFLQASTNPLGAITAVAYEGQPAQLRKYIEGYENYFDNLPILNPEDRLVQLKSDYSANVLHQLVLRLSGEDWIMNDTTKPGTFERTILAIGDKYIDHGRLVGGPEVIVAEWGKGFKSPVHGHSTGLLYEEIIKGKFIVNTYRITDLQNRVARIVESKVYSGNQQVLHLYHPQKDNDDQSLYVHSFIAVEESKSLHYIPGHSQDGRTNSFTVDHFPIQSSDISSRIRRRQIAKGNVVLSRCEAGKEFGDHYFYVTGNNGEHICLTASEEATNYINSWGHNDEDIYLLFNGEARKRFLEFHGLEDVLPVHKSMVREILEVIGNENMIFMPHFM